MYSFRITWGTSEKPLDQEGKEITVGCKVAFPRRVYGGDDKFTVCSSGVVKDIKTSPMYEGWCVEIEPTFKEQGEDIVRFYHIYKLLVIG